MNLLFLLLILAAVFVFVLLIVAAFLILGQSGGTKTSPDEARETQAIFNNLIEMEKRIENIESLLIDDLKPKDQGSNGPDDLTR